MSYMKSKESSLRHQNPSPPLHLFWSLGWSLGLSETQLFHQLNGNIINTQVAEL